jgi:hypothetical protein
VLTENPQRAVLVFGRLRRDLDRCLFAGDMLSAGRIPERAAYGHPARRSRPLDARIGVKSGGNRQLADALHIGVSSHLGFLSLTRSPTARLPLGCHAAEVSGEAAMGGSRRWRDLN